MHAFVVPIRDEDGAVLRASRIEDDGRKLGLNGVDNGRIWFDGVRVPREALLNRYADVTEDGTLRPTSRTPTAASSRCSAPSSRAGCASAAPGSTPPRSRWPSRSEYAHRRRQFEAPTGDEEDLLLDYGMHQRRLFPLLARTYALHFAQEVVAADLHEVFSGDRGGRRRARRRELESRAAGTKALGTWHATRRSRSAARPAAARATCRSTGSPR